jgi:hypothetical protein
MQLQMADQSIQFSEGIARDVMVKIQDHYAPANFMVLDMGEEDDNTPIILGRPFLNTTNTAIIYVGSGQVHFQFSEEKICCYFNSYTTYKHPKKNRSRRRRQSSCCQENQTLWNEWEESKEPEEPMKDEPTPPKSSS